MSRAVDLALWVRRGSSSVLGNAPAGTGAFSWSGMV